MLVELTLYKILSHNKFLFQLLYEIIELSVTLGKGFDAVAIARWKSFKYLSVKLPETKISVKETLVKLQAVGSQF